MNRANIQEINNQSEIKITHLNANIIIQEKRIKDLEVLLNQIHLQYDQTIIGLLD